MEDVDNSSYAVALRLRAAEQQIDKLIGLTEDLLKLQQNLFDRLEKLEKSANTLHLKRTPKNE